MNFKCTLAAGSAALALLGGYAAAQETTSAVRGTVTDEAGAPLAGATVTVRDEASGLTRTVTTNASGDFRVRNLPVGDDYSVSVTSSGFAGERAEGVELNLGQTADLTFDLEASASDQIVVVGTRSVTEQVAIGPNATFGLGELQTVPAINRNITDVIRADARIYIDESEGGVNAIQCAGQNPRFNSLTVDGVRLNDSFGLNDNGYPTERIPFSFDAIEQVSVELAPFDVEYGGFSACNINAVTKSGTNEFTGSLFYDFTSDDLRGDSLEGRDVALTEFDESRYGINIGGPIIKDRLFFFAAYEKLEGVNTFDRGPVGSGAVNEVSVTQAELDEIAAIARDIYQYEPGGIPQGVDNEDEKLLIKLDWNISDQHRAAFTYNYNDGFNITEADDDNTEFEFANHLYERGAELKSYVGSIYSDWTDNFSTEVRVGYVDLQNRQLSVGGTDFGEIRVELDEVDVYLGGDDSRQTNQLSYEVFNYALKGKYDFKGHNITFGYEREELEVFNLFVQHTETEIRFDGIDNFRDGLASAVYYNNAPSLNPADAAADWGYALNTVYAQDEFDLTDNLSIVAGLRYDWYTSDDLPVENPDFVSDYGFSNAQNLDGEGLLQPRFAFTWDPIAEFTLRGGVGLYSGGNPNVWLSNSYSANNVLQFGQRGRGFGLTDDLTNRDGSLRNPLYSTQRSLFDASVEYSQCEDGVPNGPGWCVPTDLADAVAGGTGDNFAINYTDPDFENPSEWKFNLGATYLLDALAPGFLGGEYILNADLLWSRGQDSAIILQGDIDRIGTTTDGYPIYDSVREESLVLTNSSEGNRSFTASFSVSKDYDNGFDWALGYAYNDSEDVNAMASAVAFTNYVERAFFDPQEQVRSTSDYNIKHRLTLTTGWEREFFGDYTTRITTFSSLNEGRPYSIAQNGTASIYNFTPFLDFKNNVLLEPGTRNANAGSWWGKMDIRLEQEFPGIRENDKTSAFIVIDNFTNLLNDEWGILREANFPPTSPPGGVPESRVGDASLYEIRVGVKYDF